MKRGCNAVYTHFSALYCDLPCVTCRFCLRPEYQADYMHLTTCGVTCRARTFPHSFERSWLTSGWSFAELDQQTALLPEVLQSSDSVALVDHLTTVFNESDWACTARQARGCLLSYGHPFCQVTLLPLTTALVFALICPRPLMHLYPHVLVVTCAIYT